MKQVRILILMALGLGSVFSQAHLSTSRHTVVGLLSMGKGVQTRLYVNPMNRGRYTLNVKNTASVAQLMKRKEYNGLVRVQMDVVKGEDQVRVLKITPVRLRRVPIYDSNFVAVANGNG